MKKSLLVCALGAAFAVAGVAHADTVSGTYTFTDQTNNNSLTISATPNPGTFTEFGVPDNGISYTDSVFFFIHANIPGSGSSTQTDQLQVSFSITQPGNGSGSQSGQGTEDQDHITGNFDRLTGSVTWNAPAVISLSDGQTLYIDLGDITLGTILCGDSDMCGVESATFTLTPTQDPPAATPEPGSLALLGTSILGGAGILRRRFRA
jgi:PEP-CTERM motif